MQRGELRRATGGKSRCASAASAGKGPPSFPEDWPAGKLPEHYAEKYHLPARMAAQIANIAQKSRTPWPRRAASENFVC